MNEGSPVVVSFLFSLECVC